MTGDELLVYLLWALAFLTVLLIGGAVETWHARRRMRHERVVRRLRLVTRVKCAGGHYVPQDRATWTVKHGWQCPTHELRRRASR
jgi:hypothetical protein